MLRTQVVCGAGPKKGRVTSRPHEDGSWKSWERSDLLPRARAFAHTHIHVPNTSHRRPGRRWVGLHGSMSALTFRRPRGTLVCLSLLVVINILGFWLISLSWRPILSRCWPKSSLNRLGLGSNGKFTWRSYSFYLWSIVNTLVICCFWHFSIASLIAIQVCERLGWLARSESYIYEEL